MHINRATIADIPALCTLLDELFTQEAEFQPQRETQSRGLAAIIEHPAVGQVFVARQGGKIVGMANLLYTVSTALGERVALLEDMVVAADARGAGIGSQLLQHVIEAARLSGCQRVTLLTDRANLSGQRFYQRHGFDISSMLPMRLGLNGA